MYRAAEDRPTRRLLAVVAAVPLVASVALVASEPRRPIMEYDDLRERPLEAAGGWS